MTKEYKVGDEPIPGYRLAKFLGRGGFGEVWRAVGPGGTEVALKSIALDRKQGMKEFRSLRLVKRIHHPNLVPVLAFWLIDTDGHPLDDDSVDLLGSSIIDSKSGPSAAAVATATMQFNPARPDQLLIAMGLGEKNLLDVLKGYQAKGLSGIPLEELLDYMEGSARAIDFLNTARHDLGGAEPVAIQHCDIKPQNIMLVGDAVQVCDFGLARSLTDVRSTSVAGSIAYGAPELFWENKPTHATDQYSLAITYYELRTGQLPFGADMAAIEVMQAHRDGKLDLRHVAEAERAVLKRATSPSPGGRFEKSIDMVRALRRATQDGAATIDLAGAGRPPATGIRSSIVQTGREIVPGYTLLEHLFHPDARTDVWSANTPEGTPQAIWLYDLSAAGGGIDREALRLLQGLTDQPRLARVNGWWLLNKSAADVTNMTLSASTVATSVEEATPTTLVIASELTRTNLAHRVEECRQFRGRGIPVEELLGYMQQLAEGLDALNDAAHVARDARRVSLIHTDLRPANVLVFGQTVKIGNLAWCRALEGESAEVGGMPVRALRPTMAPELIAGRVNRRTDQYSLAASYVQMRTGSMLLESGLPTSAASGVVLTSSLDLSGLFPGEVEVVQRAMHADPNQRYASCLKMVAELALAIKKVPAGAIDAAYPAGVTATVGIGTAVGAAGTMISSGVIDNRNQATVTLPEARYPGDTRPDVHQTVVHEAPAPARQRRLTPKTLVAAAGLIAVALAAAFTGKQTEADVNRLLDAGEYKSAFDVTEAPLWRRWRSDPRQLRQQVISRATEDAKKLAENSEIQKALLIQNQLKDDLNLGQQGEFRGSVFRVAIQAANEKADARNYDEAYKIFSLLADNDAELVSVVELGKGIWKRWAVQIQEHAALKNFAAAARVFQQLESVDAPEVREAKAAMIAAGIRAIGEAESGNHFNEALDIANRLTEVPALADDSGLKKAINDMLPRAVAAAQAALEKDNLDAARALYKQLVAIQAGDTQVRDLGQSILQRELAKARGRLAENNWEAALTEYDRVNAELSPDETDAATEELGELRGRIVQAAKREFDEKLKGGTPGDLDRAKNIGDRLAASLPAHPTVDALVEEYKRRSSMTGSKAPVLTPEMIVGRLLNRADENIRDRVLDEAESDLAEADAKLADLPMRADLLRRAIVAHAYLCWQRKEWEQAQSWLAKIQEGDPRDEAEAALRTRYHLLGVLVSSRFDGGSLPSDVNLDAVSASMAALRKSDAAWADSADRLLATRGKELSRELGRQAANFSASAEPEKRALGGSILERIDRAYLPDPAAVEMLVAVNATFDLLADPTTTWPQVEKSLAAWTDGRDRLPGELQGRLVVAFARWGGESEEPGSLEKAIDEVVRLPRASEAPRRALAELLVEQLHRLASSEKVNWQALDDNCRQAESAATAAGATDLKPFIKACQAECAVEKALAASTTPPESALHAVDELLNASPRERDRPYIDYVIFHVADAMRRPVADEMRARIGDRLCDALGSPPPLLAAGFRWQAAAAALARAAPGLFEDAGETDAFAPPPLAAETAGRVSRWIERALGIDAKLADYETKLVLAAATAAKTPPDDAALARLIEELSADPDCRSAWVLLRGAQAVAKTQPAVAVRRYARALEAAEGATLVGEAAQTAYDKVIKPALALAEKHAPLASADSDLKQAVASLYATKGRLVRTQYTLLAAGELPDSEAFKCFDLAVKYEPVHAEYYVQRGFARWSMSGGNPNLEVLEQEDIAPLFDGRRGAPPPGAYGLRGQSKILQARREEKDRLDLYQQSIADFEEAIRASEAAPGEHFSEFLDGLGTANVEIANYSNEGREAKRAYLHRTLDLAAKSKAMEFRPHPEHAWINHGNAEEDFSWVLKETDSNHYCAAIDAFERAAAEANAALGSPALSLLSQGRCRFKLLTSGGSCGKTFNEEVTTALENLEQAIHAGDDAPTKALPDRLRGQACYWQAQLHTLAAAKDPAKKKERYQLADAALQRAIKIAGRDGVAEYYLSSIALAMNLQDNALGLERVKAFVAADLPAASLDSKVVAIEYAADINKRRNDAKAAVGIFTQYLNDPRFKEPTTARCDLLYDRAFFIASVPGRFWTDNKKLCEESAGEAIALAKKLNEPRREAKAWRVRAENAKLSYTSSTPSQAERKVYAEHLRKAVECIPGKDDLKETWGWRVDLARVDYDIANAAVKASAFADAAWFSEEAVKTLQGVDAFAKGNPQLITSITQIRKTMGETHQKYRQQKLQ